MPTFARRQYVPLAVEWFLRQDYAPRELIVVDDGPEPIEDLIPDDERVRLLRLPRRQSIGAKRNLGAQVARGDFIAHWDDDDWSAPRRLAYQIGALRDADADIVRPLALLYLELGGAHAWRYAWSGRRQWVSDGTLLYTKEFWGANPMPDTSMGLDCRLFWSSRRRRLVDLEDETIYVATMHEGNTSRNVRAEPLATRGSRHHRVAAGRRLRLLRDAADRLMEPIAQQFHDLYWDSEHMAVDVLARACRRSSARFSTSGSTRSCSGPAGHSS